MRKRVLAFMAAVALAAVARGGNLLEVHLESPSNAPTARAWVLRGTGRAAETVYLDSSVLLDQTAVAAADVVSGPDGAPQIRVVLTSDSAQKLRDITARHVGRRLGIVLDGQLQAAPFIMASIDNGTLVVGGGFTAAEAEALARRLGPPASTTVPAAVAPASLLDTALLSGLQGTWIVVSSAMNGQLRDDPKLTKSTWTFRENELTMTNGEGQKERFALRTDAGAPGSLRLDPVPPSKERGGWMIFARDGEQLTLAFGDNLEGRPDDLAPAPKKVVLKLARKSPR
jgi:uncharacterized protein (TIGR03067 family)